MRRRADTFDREMTLDEVAAELGIDRSRVHQLEQAGLRKMRERCEAVGLKPADFIEAWRALPSAMDGNRRTRARGGC